MKKIIAVALAAGVALSVPAVADARQGCGPGAHRNYNGRCVGNRGRGVAVVAPGLVIGRFYGGRGYWDGRRYYQHRYRYNRGWRYR